MEDAAGKVGDVAIGKTWRSDFATVALSHRIDTTATLSLRSC
jgi:hypothetical protein